VKQQVEQIAEMVTSYENEKIEKSSKHKETIDRLELNYWKGLLEFTKSQNIALREHVKTTHDTELKLANTCATEHKLLFDSIKEEFKGLGQNQELTGPQLEYFGQSLDNFAQIDNNCELLRIKSLKVVQEEELVDLEEMSLREQKIVVSKAPPGIF